MTSKEKREPFRYFGFDCRFCTRMGWYARRGRNGRKPVVRFGDFVEYRNKRQLRSAIREFALRERDFLAGRIASR